MRGAGELSTALTAVDGLETRPWSPGDLALLRDAEPAFSARTLTQRFRSGCVRLPPVYLRFLAARTDDAGWLGHVAIIEGRLAGIAECAWAPGSGDVPELSLLVTDDWQRRGVGRAVAVALLARCADQGLTTLAAESEAGNDAAGRLVRSIAAPGPGLLQWATVVEVLPDQIRRFTLTLEEPQ